MRERLSVVVFTVLSILCIVALEPAYAQKIGGGPPIDASASQDFPAGGIGNSGECAFPVRIETKGKGGAITLPGGRFIFTSPGLKATLTNLNDPTKSVTLNITGAQHQATDQNGDIVTIATGRNLLGDPDAGFVLAIGSFSFKFDASDNLVQPLAGTGQLIKVCSLIS
jgi:hypothetical protein